MFFLVRAAIIVVCCQSLGAWGLLAYFVADQVISKLIVCCLGLLEMNSMDQSCWYDNESNRVNIMALQIFTHCKTETLTEVIQRRMVQKFKRMRCSVTKVLDRYYFKELGSAELERQLRGAVVIRDDIKSMKEISGLISEEQNKTFPDGELLWKCWICTNVDGEVICVFKVHHCVGDGLGLSVMFASVQDEKYKPEQFIQTSAKLTFCQTVVMRLL